MNQQSSTQKIITPNASEWYKEAIIYELHIRAFFDSDADGVGDLKGLTQKLDYLQDLGVTALWVLPFYPSPLRDDGYDIADYYSINPTYGDMRDFRTFMKEAHSRGLKVITELVLNHTSDQHPWFQRARRAPKDSRFRNFYVWNDDPDRYRETRIIFQDFEPSNWSWDPIAEQYYWHRFYHHQPDLNFDNSEVRRAMFKVLDFWLGMGVDGLRLDAVPYLYERDGTNNENLPETHAYLRTLRKHVDEHFPGRMLLGEANQWPDDSIAYFGKGDECQMAFHFPLMPRLFMSVRMEDRFPIIEILDSTPAIPPTCQWALFLRNHDELTLEMVTDEERDYMYRVYASDPQARVNLGIRRRLAPLLGNNRRKIELMNGLLFSLPGTPIIYYGDELGMGDNVYLGDRNGVRTPMQWSGDRNAGFSRANPQKLYFPVIIDPEYHYETVNVETEQSNPHSLYWWMKRLIALRKKYPVFGLGSLEFLFPGNRKVLAYLRRHNDETILVVANLSRFAQAAELNLSEFYGAVPIELFGQTRFPRIETNPYVLTVGPHSFLWFSLQQKSADLVGQSIRPAELTELTVAGTWDEILHSSKWDKLVPSLISWLPTRRWFGGKGKVIQAVHLSEDFPLANGGYATRLIFIRVEYTEGEPETYLLTLTLGVKAKGEAESKELEKEAICRITADYHGNQVNGYLIEAMSLPNCGIALLDLIRKRKIIKGLYGELDGTLFLPELFNEAVANSDLIPRAMGREQSNSSINFSNRLNFKIFRRGESGPNPELEIGRHLAERNEFTRIPKLLGALEYTSKGKTPQTLAILQNFVASEGDAWSEALDNLGHFYESVLVLSAENRMETAPLPNRTYATHHGIPDQALELIGPYLEKARLIGQRTAEMHLALAAKGGGPAFEPEEFSELYLRSISHGMLARASLTFAALRQGKDRLSIASNQLVLKVLEYQGKIEDKFRRIKDAQINTLRIRVHGDYHLGQILCAGNDYVVIDFEGEPSKSIGERRIKRSPLKDIAGMLRSFHYASESALAGPVSQLALTEDQKHALEPWGRFWSEWAGASFLNSYIPPMRQARILPKEDAELDFLLRIYLLDKAVYELEYELNNRPSWIDIPLRGLLQIMEASQ